MSARSAGTGTTRILGRHEKDPLKRPFSPQPIKTKKTQLSMYLLAHGSRPLLFSAPQLPLCSPRSPHGTSSRRRSCRSSSARPHLPCLQAPPSAVARCCPCPPDVQVAARDDHYRARPRRLLAPWPPPRCRSSPAATIALGCHLRLLSFSPSSCCARRQPYRVTVPVGTTRRRRRRRRRSAVPGPLPRHGGTTRHGTAR